MQNKNGQWLKRATPSMLLGLALLISGTAQADPKACITAHATGQREAKAGHLRLATQLFTTCGSDDSCPSQLRQECAEYLQSVLQTMPTVIFSVTDEKGNDVTAVKVFSTDDLIVDGLDGRAIQIDPGKHRLRFLLPSGTVLSSDVLIREAEKNRMIRVKAAEEGAEDGAPTAHDAKSATPAAQPAAPPPAAPPAAPPAPPAPSKPPVAAWVAGGVAFAALGVGTTFAILGSSNKSEIDACSPNCGSDKRSTYDGLKRDYLIADIGFGLGIVSAGVATWLFLAPPSSKSESAPGTVARAKAPAVQAGGAPLPGGGAVVLTGQF